MPKRASLEQVQEEIDAIHEISNLKAISTSSTSDSARINASRTLLEIAGLLKGDTKKTSLEGNNVRLVIED